MFNVGGGEVLVILLIAIIVLGPDKLPNAAKQAGKLSSRPMDSRSVERSGNVLADLVATVEHNLSREAAEPSRFEGRAQSRHVDPRHLPAFRAFLEREGQGLLERVDDWLATHEVAAGADADVPRIRLGVGVYAIHDSQTGDPS